MAKLYFRFGAMSSAKTLNLLATAHSYESQGKSVLVMKPKMDTRFGEATVQSRAGLDRAADVLLTKDSTFSEESVAGTSCILVDESQFLHPTVIERLRDVSTSMSIPVICYGLRTDFRARLFPGAKRLMELADSIEEVKTTCAFCNRKAIMNLKSVNGVATMDGPTVCLGCEEMYVPACYLHFCEKISAATGGPVDFQAAWTAGDAADLAQGLHAAQSDPQKEEGKKEPEKAPAQVTRKEARDVTPEGRKTREGIEEPEKERSPQKCKAEEA
jgi:thymidine kinase